MAVSPGDLGLVRHLLRGYILETYRDMGISVVEGRPNLDEVDRIEIERPFGSVGSLGFIALAGLRGDGFSDGMVMLRNDAGSASGTIRRLYVQGARRKGAGTALMHYALNEATRLGCNAVDLTVIPQRKHVIRWYRSIGFQRDEGWPSELGVRLVLEIG